MTLAATVKNLTRSGGSPGGWVIFMDGRTELGSVQLQNGRATLTTSTLHAGSNVIKAEYDPATGFRASAASVVETVRKPRSTLKAALQREAPLRTAVLARANAGSLVAAYSGSSVVVGAAQTILGPLILGDGTTDNGAVPGSTGHGRTAYTRSGTRVVGTAPPNHR
jgi:hypothetical protein